MSFCGVPGIVSYNDTLMKEFSLHQKIIRNIKVSLELILSPVMLIQGVR